jgi:predicted RNA-binding protein with EMAP domain
MCHRVLTQYFAVSEDRFFQKVVEVRNMRVTQHSRTLCQWVKLDGGKCQVRKIAGSSYCFFHDPEKTAEREAAQRTEALKNQVAVLPSSAPDARLLDARDVVKLIAETINHVRRGEVDPKVANSVGYLAGRLMKALHASEIEKRLAALEMAVKRTPGAPEFILDGDRRVQGTNGYK